MRRLTARLSKLLGRHERICAVVASTAAHLLLLGLLVCSDGLLLLPDGLRMARLTGPLELEARFADHPAAPDPATATFQSEAQQTAPIPAASLSVDALRQLRDFYGNDLPQPSGRDPGEFVQESVRRAAAQAASQSAEELHDKLQGFNSTLERVSSAERIGTLSQQFSQWLNTAERETKPVQQPVEGSFDFDTAQFHEVLREANDHGTFRYEAILVDAAGQTCRVALDENEGRRLYATMSLIKKHPLLESVYRGVVIALLDKMAAAAGEGT